LAFMCRFEAVIYNFHHVISLISLNKFLDILIV
jgi:hypothetical protein